MSSDLSEKSPQRKKERKRERKKERKCKSTSFEHSLYSV